MASKQGLAQARRMVRLSAKIFGNLTKEARPEESRVVRMFARRPRGPALTNYYPPMQQLDSLVKRLRLLGLYTDDHLDFKELMDEKRAARGKGKPKKGEGKQQQKKKKR